MAVAGLAAYTLSRQFILGLRSEPPLRWRYGRQVTAAAAAVVLIGSVALLARGWPSGGAVRRVPAGLAGYGV